MTSHRALGLHVTFDDDEDAHRYGTGQRDRGGIGWCRADDGQPSGEQAPVVTIGPAPGSVARAVIHPVPMESDLWGTIAPNERLARTERNSKSGPPRLPGFTTRTKDFSRTNSE